MTHGDKHFRDRRRRPGAQGRRHRTAGHRHPGPLPRLDLPVRPGAGRGVLRRHPVPGRPGCHRAVVLRLPDHPGRRSRTSSASCPPTPSSTPATATPPRIGDELVHYDEWVARAARHGPRRGKCSEIGQSRCITTRRGCAGSRACGSMRIFAWVSGSPSASKAAATPASPTLPVTSGVTVELAVGQHVQGVAELQRRVAEHEPQVDLLADGHGRTDLVGAHADADDDHPRRSAARRR